MKLKLLSFHVVAAFGLLSSSLAGDAVFSADGTTVTLVPVNKPGFLEKVTIESGAVKFTALPKELKEADITSLTRGAEGELMFLANDALWILKEGEPARKIASTAPAKDARDLFVDTKEGSPTLDWIFFSGSDGADAQSYEAKLYARKPGEKSFKSIFCRRIGDVTSGVFSTSGRMFFAGDHDIWEGGISPSDDMNERLGTLIGARVAPLAAYNTDDSNGGSLGVDEIVPIGKWLYVHLRGHHIGALVRCPIPAKPLYAPGIEEQPSVKSSYATMLGSLGKAEVIMEDLSDVSGFCATEVDGKPLVFFRTFSEEEGKGKQLMTWDGTGKPKIIGHEPVEE